MPPQDRYFNDRDRQKSSGALFRNLFNNRRGRGRDRGNRSNNYPYDAPHPNYRTEQQPYYRNQNYTPQNPRDEPDRTPHFGDAAPGTRIGLGLARPVPPEEFDEEPQREDDPDAAFPTRRRDQGRETMRFGVKRDRSHFPEPDVNLTSRRLHKRVPGGRIAKYFKQHEYKADTLWCQVCEKEFMDENGKGLHDRSIDHRRQLSYVRGRDDMPGFGAGGAGVSEVDAIVEEQLEEEVASSWVPGRNKVTDFTPGQIQVFFQKNGASFTADFKAWANRSLREAKEAAAENNDPVVVRSVQKEVIAEFIYHTDECTMRHESWGRKPSATGANYRGSTVAQYKQHVVSDSNLEKVMMDRPIRPVPPRPTQTGNRTWDRGDFENMRPKNEIIDVEPEHPVVEPDAIVPSGVVADVHPGEVAPASNVDREGLQPVSNVPKQLKALTVTWKQRPNGPAMQRYLSCQGINREMIMKRTWRFAARVKNGADEADKEKESVDVLMEKYHSLRKQFEEEDYEYADWYQGVNEVVAGFKERGTRKASLQSCLQMQVCAAMACEEWEQCFLPCSELVQMYKEEKDMSWIGTGAQYVGYWLLSLLFNAANKREVGKRKGRSGKGTGTLGYLTVNSRMRDFPAHALEDVAVHESLQVFRAVITNNYWKFFDLHKNGLMHVKTMDRSKYLMDELVDVVRERALISIAMTSCLHDDPVFHPPAQLEYVIANLGWGGERKEDGSDPGLIEAREFIGRLPQGIKLFGDVNVGRSACFVVNRGKAEVQKSRVVDVETLVSMSGKAWRLRTH